MRYTKQMLLVGLIVATCIACAGNDEQISGVEVQAAQGADVTITSASDLSHGCLQVYQSSGPLLLYLGAQREIIDNGEDRYLAESTGKIYAYDPVDGVYSVVGEIRDLDKFRRGIARLQLVGDMLCLFEDLEFSPSQRFPVYRIDNTFVGIYDARSDNLGFAYAVTTSQDGLTWSLSSVTSIYPVLFFERDGSYLVVVGTEVWDITDLSSPQVSQTLPRDLFPPASSFQQPHYSMRASAVYAYPLGSWVFARLQLLAEASFQETLYIIDTTDLSVEQFLWGDFSFPNPDRIQIQATDQGNTMVFYPFLLDSQEAIIEIDPNGPSGTVIRTLREPVDES